MPHILEFDPNEVLGLADGATLSEIRDAYHARSKRYHPDAGGDSWAFRIVTRSYELLSTARVMGRASAEMEANPVRTPTSEPDAPGERFQATRSKSEEGHVRRGVRDDVPVDRRVVVETLLLRFEIDNAMDLLSESPEDRNLSCNMRVTWPCSGGRDAATGPEGALIRKHVLAAIKAASRARRPLASEIQEEGQGPRLVAWLSYGTARQADEAFQALLKSLHASGLGVEQTIRDLSIPREWSE